MRQSAAIACRNFIDRYATPISNAFQRILVFGGRVHLTFVGNESLQVNGLAHNVLNVVASARRLNIVSESPLAYTPILNLALVIVISSSVVCLISLPIVAGHHVRTPVVLPGNFAKVFFGVGAGKIDLSKHASALDEAQYDGWLVYEAGKAGKEPGENRKQIQKIISLRNGFGQSE